MTVKKAPARCKAESSTGTPCIRPPRHTGKHETRAGRFFGTGKVPRRSYNVIKVQR